MTNWNDILKIEPYERATAKEFAEEDMDDEPIENRWKRDIAQKKKMLTKTILLIQSLYNDALRKEDRELIELYKTTQDGLMRAIEQFKA